MSDENKHIHPEPDFNAILDRVEQAMKDGTLEELPMVKPAQSEAADLARIAIEQDAMGGFTHLDQPSTVKADPDAAKRIHGKENPRVHIETYGCQMNTKNTTRISVLQIVRQGIGAIGGRFLPLAEMGNYLTNATARYPYD